MVEITPRFLGTAMSIEKCTPRKSQLYRNAAWFRENYPLGNPDCWAYSREFERFAARYRTYFNHALTDGVIFRELISWRKRNAKIPEDQQLPKKRTIDPPEYTKVVGKDAELLKRLYAQQNVNSDSLAYSLNFDVIYSSFQSESGSTLSRHDVFRNLFTYRKRGKGSLPPADTVSSLQVRFF